MKNFSRNCDFLLNWIFCLGMMRYMTIVIADNELFINCLNLLFRDT